MEYNLLLEKIYLLINTMINNGPIKEEDIKSTVFPVGCWTSKKILKNNWEIYHVYEDSCSSDDDFTVSIKLKYKNRTILKIVSFSNEDTFTVFFTVYYFEMHHSKDMSLMEYTLSYDRIDEHLSGANIIILKDIDYLIEELSKID